MEQNDGEVNDFTCPNCGGHGIEGVQTGVTVVTAVSLSADGRSLLFGEQTNYDGGSSHFQCDTCGELIGEEGEVTTDQDLMDYLEEHH